MTLTCHAGVAGQCWCHTDSFSVCLTGLEIAMLSRWLHYTSLITLLSPHITFSALPQYRDPGQVTALLSPSQPIKHPPCTSGNICLSELCIFALLSSERSVNDICQDNLYIFELHDL